MSRIDDVLAALCTAAGAAITNANVVGSSFTVQPKGTLASVQPGQVLPGWPLVTEMVNILGQGAGEWQVTAWPIGKPKATTRYSPYDGPGITAPTIPLTSTIAGAVITFGGSVATAPLYIHTVVNGVADAFVATTPSQALSSVASAVAAAVNALALSGVSASASGAAVTLAGVHAFDCNIVGDSGSVSYEIARFERAIQLSTWASDPVTRSLISGALESLGGTLQTFLPLADGSSMYVSSEGSDVDDDSQSSYSLYIGHQVLSVEYGVMAVVSTAQVGAIENLVTLNAAPPKPPIWVG